MQQKLSRTIPKTGTQRHEMWAEIELMLRKQWDGKRVGPCYKTSSCRSYRIPSSTNGYLTLTIRIYNRYCKIEVDRWGTTNYDKRISEAWFENNIWPVITEGLNQISGNKYTVMPRGGDHVSAWPIPRDRILEVLPIWMEAEKYLGLSERKESIVLL